MRALLTTGTPPWVAHADAADPEPLPHEALVSIRAISLNRGEVLDLEHAPRGIVPGWDLAGVVRTAAADGRGPAAGARVVGLARAGAWAELAAVPAGDLALLPDEVSDAVAAALPTAGATALRSLELGGLLTAKRVLVTGATGGVGRLAVQLARAAGAHVTALVRSHVEPAELGADRVVAGIEEDFDLIVDAVGGETFGAAIEHLRPHGTVVNLATTDPEERVSFRAGAFDRAPGASIRTLNLVEELAWAGGAAGDLDRLVALVAAGVLRPPIGLEATWEAAAEAIAALKRRAFGGKAVLHVAC
jgi:NADPH2:quinone reductase